ncbi:MAG: monomeric [FeFe] hydrogenase [Prevotellaceae bacterium]|jgi:[FeFe] hydrogenase (group B1/B3)|nr:monomeric [FeFe] hydrogenase [Prevotellaceae bacterium]
MSTNYATLLRRNVFTSLCKLYLDNELIEKIDRLPIEMHPRGKQTIRCCTHKARAVAKYRTMAILGFNYYDEEDELTPLSTYAILSRERTQHTDIFMTVVDEACSSCVKSSYTVTNLCRGCVGRHCAFACNKGAVMFRDGQAHIDTEKCVNCGMCMKACPFKAIIYQPVPCEETCPVGAINKNERGVEEINSEKCIQCGRCISACPFGAIIEKTDIFDVIDAIRTPGKKVIALSAPAIFGQFKAEPGKIITAIRKLGFDEVIEVAKGANITSQNEADEFEERIIEGDEKLMTTSCCPSYVQMVKKHMPEIQPYVSHTRTPMSYTAELVKNEQSDAVTVFISPCIAKRYEGYHDPNVDYVLTIEELDSWLTAQEIDILECDSTEVDATIHPSGRGYPLIKGVANSVVVYSKEENKVKVKPIIIDGLNKQNIRILRSYAKECPGNLVEVMSCEGGCVGGCSNTGNIKTAIRQIQTFSTEKK